MNQRAYSIVSVGLSSVSTRAGLANRCFLIPGTAQRVRSNFSGMVRRRSNNGLNLELKYRSNVTRNIESLERLCSAAAHALTYVYLGAQLPLLVSFLWHSSFLNFHNKTNNAHTAPLLSRSDCPARFTKSAVFVDAIVCIPHNCQAPPGQMSTRWQNKAN